LLMLFISLST